MKKHSILILASTVLLFAACNPKKDTISHGNSNNPQISQKVANDTLSTFDTTIVLSNIITSEYSGINLTDTLAKRVLYNYFKKKGYYSSENLPDIAQLTENDNKLSVDYTSIFIADFNNNTKNDAVITYWLTPPYANGHCWQPHKAVMVDTDNGYKITNEEFMPTNFAIDSIKKVNDQLTIFGYDYDCSNQKSLRKLRIKLTK
jgi:hypothetical protein